MHECALHVIQALEGLEGKTAGILASASANWCVSQPAAFFLVDFPWGFLDVSLGFMFPWVFPVVFLMLWHVCQGCM